MSRGGTCVLVGVEIDYSDFNDVNYDADVEYDDPFEENNYEEDDDEDSEDDDDVLIINIREEEVNIPLKNNSF